MIYSLCAVVTQVVMIDKYALTKSSERAQDLKELLKY